MSVGEPIVLTPVEARVLGALVEKEITTPDYYPLTLNALINACNQRSNREPVMDVDEDEARQALHALKIWASQAARDPPTAACQNTSTGLAKPSISAALRPR